MHPDQLRRAAVAVIVLALLVAGGVTLQRHRNRIISDPITREAPELGGRAQVLIPNLQGATVWVPDRPHDPSELRGDDRFERIRRLRSFQVWTNSIGLRGPELANPRTGPRILCLGDSVTFGWGVPYEESYPARLAAKLGLEVVDAGVPAMRPHSIANWAQGHAAALQPDLVIFTSRPDWSEPEAVLGYQRAVRQVQQSIGRARLVIVMPAVSTFDPKGSQVYAQEAAEVRAALPDVPLIDLTGAFRAALPLPGVIMEQSDGHQRVYDLPGHSLRIDAIAPQVGLAPEIVAMFEDDPNVAEPLFYDGGHPDTAGYALFADTLAAWLGEQGLVPR
jgi:lysophospholipase L1-like esterase